MPRLSQTLRFLQSPSFQQVQSALIGQLTQCIVIGRTPQAIRSFSFQVSFISSSPRVEQSCMTDKVMMLVCICSTQATVKMISDGLYTLLGTVFPSHTHTHTTPYVQNSAFERSIANTSTNNKTYLQLLIQKRQIVIAKSQFTLFFIYPSCTASLVLY